MDKWQNLEEAAQSSDVRARFYAIRNARQGLYDVLKMKGYRPGRELLECCKTQALKRGYAIPAMLIHAEVVSHRIQARDAQCSRQEAISAVQAYKETAKLFEQTPSFSKNSHRQSNGSSGTPGYFQPGLLEGWRSRVRRLQKREASADVTGEATPELPHWMGWSRYGVGAMLLGHLLYYMYQIMLWAEPKGAPGVLAWLVVASIGGAVASWLSTAAELLLLVSVLTGGLLGGGLGGFVAALIGEGVSIQEFVYAGASAGTGLAAFGCVLVGQFFVLAIPALPFVMAYAPRSAPPAPQEAAQVPPLSPSTGHAETAPPKQGEHIPAYLTEEDAPRFTASPQKEHIPGYLTDDSSFPFAATETASAAATAASAAAAAPAAAAPAAAAPAVAAPAPTLISFFGASAWVDEAPAQSPLAQSPPAQSPPAQVHANAMTLDIDLDFDLDGLQGTAPPSAKPL